ncbi:PEP-CTERM sorting domain-containing protein [Thalassomonas actiniarum]|uniref:PEP-CTERM sorting domain-containing protein n=1 Tax=Thalassomonas actiniarum TaxID=485447 RepID=A0AAE9YN36_9GAMM|nr:PEP-CTERM sorting domain-containing protein [Thalassomonas actiniarum]WDD98179.1 PEP-CTERM sorting domain-containing protein [Thalassomonas actiniarum]
MMKLIINFLLLISLFTLIPARAALITSDLSADAYIAYQGMDWAWASPDNIQFQGCSGPADAENYLAHVYDNAGDVCSNQLMAPEFHENWRYATASELDMLLNDIGLSAFVASNGSLIQAAAYWNTAYTTVDYRNFLSGYVASEWGSTGYETFYVRDHETLVPEPSTLLLFSLMICLLAFRLRA